MKMVLFVLHDAAKLPELLNAWQAAGAGGATVLLSTGMGRISQANSLRDDLPLMPSLSAFYARDESLSRTLITVVNRAATAKRIAAATRRVVGDLSRPDTGLLVVLPVEQAEGLEKKPK
jgi:hypothetical protein